MIRGLYQQSLLNYWSNYATLEPVHKEGFEEEREEERAEGELKAKQALFMVAERLKQQGESLEKIVQLTGLSIHKLGKIK